MNNLNRATIILVGTLGLSTIATIFGDAKTGLIVLFGTTLISLAWEFERRFRVRQRRLEEQLATVKAEFAAKIGLPLVSAYFQVIERGCPLFKFAAGNSYEQALRFLTSLAKGEIQVDRDDEVFHYLTFLFRDFPAIRRIKAVSSGEFDEWKEDKSWWSKHYLGLHEAAFNRGAQIERIFVVHSKQQEKSVDAVFQKNLEYHVSVKVALQSKISPQDLQAANCLIFLDEHNEPRYALIAHHDSDGNFQQAIIHGNRESVDRINEMYERIASIARPYGIRIAA